MGSTNANLHAKIGSGEAANSQQVANSQSIILAQNQGKEADCQALSELTRALDKKVGSLLLYFYSIIFCSKLLIFFLFISETNNMIY